MADMKRLGKGVERMSNRVLCWFSCGAASAVAAKKAIEKYGDSAQVLYCDTLAYEHPDNQRFMQDVERWLGRRITVLKSQKYADIFDVFRSTGFLVGPKGKALCTIELKKRLRFLYQLPNDIHVFGFTAEEGKRIERFHQQNFEAAEFPLFDSGITKEKCHEIIAEAGIAQPAMYRMGYDNNNCIGCVKGGIRYWNKIRTDFPEAFARMAALERELGAHILTDRRGGERKPLYLDELKPDHVAPKDPEIECGVLCHTSGGDPRPEPPTKVKERTK